MLFKDVMVDEALKQRLIGMVKENRISHALLFLSPEGTAGFALAVAFAQYISCHNRSEHDSCGVCPSCVKYEKLAHPDLHLLFPNSTSPLIKKDPDSEQFYTVFRDFVIKNHYNITLPDWLETIEGENKQPSINLRDTSNIINWNSTRSYEGGYKIYILWMAERLYHAAAPRLLKTLEEPENKSLFILISESTNNILPTILSRTQMVKIGKSDTAPVAGKLDSVMLPHFQKYWQSIYCFAQNRNKQEVDFQGVCSTIEEIVKGGREYQKGFMRYLLRMVRLILLESSGNRDLIKENSSEQQVLSAFNGMLNVANVTPVIQDCNKALFHIERNGNSGLILTDLYFKIAGYLA